MKQLTTFRVIDAIARTGSIRGAADQLALTASAVLRRLKGFEDELGVELFDRGSSGAELNSAGELVVQHIRETFAETEKLRSRIADLTGLRRGDVRIGCSQALARYFLPQHIAAYQAKFPEVTFEVMVLEHGAAQKALAERRIEMALVYGGAALPDFKVLLGVRQRLAAIMAAGHPLAAFETLRLRQCYEYPILLPSKGLGSRAMIDAALQERSYAVPPTLESNSFEYLKAHIHGTAAISFQIEVGAPIAPAREPGLIARTVAERDVPPGTLWLGQLAGRNLSVAASRFCEQVSRALAESYENFENG